VQAPRSRRDGRAVPERRRDELDAIPVPAGRAEPARIAVYSNGGERRQELEKHNLYDELMRLRNAQRDSWLRRGLTVISGEHLPWETNPWGVMRWYTHPSLYDTCIRTHVVYEQRVPGGSHSGKMLHQGNSLVYVMSGSGHIVIDGVRHEFSAEDLIQLPAKPPGITFQIFNSSPSQDVRLLGVELNTADMVSVDRGCGLVNLEPAPEYEALPGDG
jgi:hypothetical protein